MKARRVLARLRQRKQIGGFSRGCKSPPQVAKCLPLCTYAQKNVLNQWYERQTRTRSFRLAQTNRGIFKGCQSPFQAPKCLPLCTYAQKNGLNQWYERQTRTRSSRLAQTNRGIFKGGQSPPQEAKCLPLCTYAQKSVLNQWYERQTRTRSSRLAQMNPPFQTRATPCSKNGGMADRPFRYMGGKRYSIQYSNQPYPFVQARPHLLPYYYLDALKVHFS